MMYLLIGESGPKKESQIAELKKKFLPAKDASKFDFELLYGTKLDAATLKKSLLALPAVCPQRLVMVYDCHKLSEACKDIIMKFCSDPQPHVVVVLESNKIKKSEAFYKKLAPGCEVLSAGEEAKKDVFAMTNAMSHGKPAEALRLLSEQMKLGNHPLQLMGVLVWFWGRQRVRMRADKYEQGLIALKTADLDIKRTRLAPCHAMEIVVAKLCSLLKG